MTSEFHFFQGIVMGLWVKMAHLSQVTRVFPQFMTLSYQPSVGRRLLFKMS